MLKKQKTKNHILRKNKKNLRKFKGKFFKRLNCNKNRHRLLKGQFICLAWNAPYVQQKWNKIYRKWYSTLSYSFRVKSFLPTYRKLVQYIQQKQQEKIVTDMESIDFIKGNREMENQLRILSLLLNVHCNFDAYLKQRYGTS